MLTIISRVMFKVLPIWGLIQDRVLGLFYMVKKVACFFIARAAIVGILFLVHAKVDSYHGSEEGSHASEQVEGNGGH